MRDVPEEKKEELSGEMKWVNKAAGDEGGRKCAVNYRSIGTAG